MIDTNNHKNSHFKIRPELLISLCLVIAILAAYWQVRSFDFILFDDAEYVIQNPHIKDGLTYDNLIWAITSTYAANWHPLTWVSHMFDISMYGMDAGHHHITNVILHIINSLLLFIILKQMTGDLGSSSFAAALFALHPLHAESVAWIAERKDVLCTLFAMLTLFTYIRYLKRLERKWYLLALLCYIAGLMAKPMLVTLPFLMLLLDYWPLKRFEIQLSDNTFTMQRECLFLSIFSKSKFYLKSVFHPVLEKLPFIIFAAISGIITLFAQHSADAVASMDLRTLNDRIANTMISYVSYICKMVWPCRLAFFYPYPGKHPLWQVIGALFLLTAICFLVFKYGRRYPFLAVGWLWYIGSLVPVIGLLQVGAQAMADRYTYIPLIGFFIIIAWGTPELLARLHYRQTVLYTLAILTLGILTFTTYRQASFWKNDITLIHHALSITANNYLAHNNLGIALTLRGKNDEAQKHFKKALQIWPSYADAHNNLGFILYAQGKSHEAIHHFRKALHENPYLIKARNNMANALISQGKTADAIKCYKDTLRFDPSNKMACDNLNLLTDNPVSKVQLLKK